MIAPERLYRSNDKNALAAVREVFSRRPEAVSYGPEEIVALVGKLRAAPQRPAVSEVEAALEALRIEGAILA